MKIRLPKALLTLVAVAAASTVQAGYYTPTTITTEGEMVLGSKPEGVEGYTIDAKDGAGKATITGDVTTESAIYVREGELFIGGTDVHNTVTINTQGGGQLRQGDSPTMLSVAGKDSMLVIDNATVTSERQVTTAVGGADGNGTLILQNGAKYDGSTQDYFIIGYQSYRISGTTPMTDKHAYLTHATTQGKLEEEKSDNTNLNNRWQGSYTAGSGNTEYGRGVVTVTDKSEMLASGVKEFVICHGELNVLKESTFSTSALPVLLGFAEGATATVNVESGSVMNMNGQLHTGSFKNAKVEINVNDATLNLNNYKGSFLGLGSESATSPTGYKDNGSVTVLNLQDKAVMNLTEEMYVGYSSSAKINVASTATINESGDSRDLLIICAAGVVDNAGDINIKTKIDGGALTLDAGSKMADITMSEGNIKVNGATSTGDLVLNGGTITFSLNTIEMALATLAAEDTTPAMMTVDSLTVGEGLKIVVQLSEADFADLENKSFSLFALNGDVTGGSIEGLLEADIVFTNGTESKVGTISATEGTITVTNTKLIPEPTTATLSLLALAALAGRRRRK